LLCSNGLQAFRKLIFKLSFGPANLLKLT
jgi:hypothetical protein